MRLSEVLERRGIHILTNHKIKRRKTSYENAVVFKLSKLYGILHSVNKNRSIYYGELKQGEVEIQA